MFTGYTDQTVDVFWGIRFNNDRAWFAEHKQEFQDAVMTPTKALAGDLYDWFQEAYPDLHLNVHISRIYRDARRLFGRGPLNDHIWFSFQNAIENRGEAPCFWFQVGADGYGCGAGWWMPAAEKRGWGSFSSSCGGFWTTTRGAPKSSCGSWTRSRNIRFPAPPMQGRRAMPGNRLEDFIICARFPSKVCTPSTSAAAARS